MIRLEFSKNLNGKLFNDCFGDIRSYDPRLYQVGTQVEIIEKGIGHGIAEIVAIKNFPYGKICDTFAFVNCGKSAAYQAEIIKRFNHGNIERDTMLMHIVVRYLQRYKSQAELIKDWWESKTLTD